MYPFFFFFFKERIPRWEIADIGDEHLEHGGGTLRIRGSKPSVHLLSHGISHPLQLPSWGPTLLLKVLHYSHGLLPPCRPLHTPPHHHRSCCRTHRRRSTYHCCTHRNLPHFSSVCVFFFFAKLLCMCLYVCMYVCNTIYKL